MKIALIAIAACAGLGGPSADVSDYATAQEAQLGRALGAYFEQASGVALNDEQRRVHDIAASWAVWHKNPGAGQTWTEPASGAGGVIVPTTRVELRDGQAFCREFTDSVRLPGLTEISVAGSACIHVFGWVISPPPA